MSEGLSRQELLDSLNDSKLLSPEELERAGSLNPTADGPALAQALVDAGLLTHFQREAVSGRRYEKLRIGNYDILDKLGAGGMGTVYKARHRRMKRIVALKVLTRNLCKDKTFVQRFQREVETLAQLSHPNIVMAFDADEAKIGHYLVMEFVNGPDLSSVVQQHGPMSLPDAVGCILQAARGLDYVHRQGMIHRDIKPANLLRDGNGVVKVTDLGLARLSSPAGETASGGLTQGGGILGTVDYMPPEQATDPTKIDHRADIYGLGATFYFLLLGQPPYQGQTMMDTVFKHREAPIPSLAAVRPDVPAALDELFQRMMAKEPADRCGSMAEVVSALEALATTFGDTYRVPLLGLAGSEDTALRPSHGKTMAGPRAVSNPTMVRAADGIAFKVLLVEPSRTQAGIIRKYLQAQDITQVVAVASGREALQAVESDRPDVIISALHLPDMTGVQLAQQVRAEHSAATPGFLLISSESQNPEAGSLSMSGQAVLLQKPFSSEKLLLSLSLAAGRRLP